MTESVGHLVFLLKTEQFLFEVRYGFFSAGPAIQTVHFRRIILEIKEFPFPDFITNLSINF